MRGWFTRSFGIVLLVLFAVGASGQSKSELQGHKKKLQQEINYTNQLLQKTAKTKESSLNQLKQLSKKISSREELIQTIEGEISLLNDSIRGHESELDSLESILEQLKEEYAEMIKSAYKNRSSYDRMMFIFSSSNFNQAFKRLKYYQQYAQYRRSQAENIQQTQVLIDAQLHLLQAVKKSKEGLLQARLQERSMLSSEKNQKEKVVQDLKGQEGKLRKELQQKQNAARKVDAAIQKIIEEEIRLAKEAARKAGGDGKGFPMTPEARELSASFASNKGKLPWPVAEGVITEQFGEHTHPTLKNVKVQNNGINITTKKNNIGRAVFNGVVRGIIIIPGEGKAVLVNHGEYYTLYSYFKDVYVSKDDKITTKQNLGVLIDGDDGSNSDMHFELWKNFDKINPELWLIKQ